ncbi:MAG: MFS transporter [Acidobacteriota bacterium]
MAETDPSQETRLTAQIIGDAFGELKSTLVAFVRAPKALWGINIPYVIEGLVYFGILTILGKYCSENVGLSDLQAGWVYSVVTAGITFAMMFLGGVCDRIGVPKALAIAFTAFVVARGLVALSGTLPLGQGLGSPMFLVMSLGLIVSILAYGLYQPAAYAGVKRYTSPNTAAMGYAVVYALMNLGAFLSGFISPVVRHRFVEVFPPNGLTAVFWAYTALCAVALAITLLVLTRATDAAAVERVARETAELTDAHEVTEENKTDSTKPSGDTKPSNLLLLVLASATAISIGAAVAATTGRLPS